MKNKTKSKKNNQKKQNEKDWEMILLKIDDAFKNETADLEINVDQMIEKYLPNVNAQYTTGTVTCCGCRSGTRVITHIC